MYVDDGIIAANDQQESEIFIKKLKARLKIVTGKASCFPVLEIKYKKTELLLLGYAKEKKKSWAICIWRIQASSNTHVEGN